MRKFTALPGSRGRGKEPNSLNDASSARALMLEWAEAENMWTRRIAILCQLLWRKTDTQLLREVIESNLGADAACSSEFFITKAMGGHCDFARHDPKWVLIVDEHHPDSALPLANISKKEALKHL